MAPVDKLFSTVPHLPSIPRVVQALITTLSDEDADLGSLVKQVKQDQSLSARVLRLANSSYYGASHKIGAIDDAITVIGINALRTLVIASGVAGAFVKVEGVDLKAFWRHSMLTAGIARALGATAGMNREFAYTAGLMHRLGQLLISMAVPALAREIAKECKNLTVIELAMVEQTHLGVDHCEVGAQLAKRWHFPAAICNALRWYSSPMAEEVCPYADIVHLAAQIALGLQADKDAESIAGTLNTVVEQRLVMDGVEWVGFIESCASLVESSSLMLEPSAA